MLSSWCGAADRLIGTTVTNPVTGATPVNQSLSSTQLAYDAHGNTTRLADENVAYDGQDRHVQTTLDDGSKVTYLRDATDRIVQRTEQAADGTKTVTRYGFTGDGDTPDFVYDGSSHLTEWDLPLAGGVTVEYRSNQAVWSYPNIHGDIITTTDAAGQITTNTLPIYDPFGQTMDQTTGLFGSTAANQAGPDTQQGNADYGWLGQHQKITEHPGSIATIEMGARQYVAALGRFLQVDPIEGGTDNAYAYVNDPLNSYDLTGKYRVCGSWNGYCMRGQHNRRMRHYWARSWHEFWNGYAPGIPEEGAVVAGAGWAARSIRAAQMAREAEAAEGVAATARVLRFRRVNGAISHGEAVWTNGKRWISHDRDGHNGGYWKMAKSAKGLSHKHTRMGTYSKNLNHRVGD